MRRRDASILFPDLSYLSSPSHFSDGIFLSICTEIAVLEDQGCCDIVGLLPFSLKIWEAAHVLWAEVGNSLWHLLPEFPPRAVMMSGEEYKLLSVEHLPSALCTCYDPQIDQ